MDLYELTNKERKLADIASRLGLSIKLRQAHHAEGDMSFNYSIIKGDHAVFVAEEVRVRKHSLKANAARFEAAYKQLKEVEDYLEKKIQLAANNKM